MSYFMAAVIFSTVSWVCLLQLVMFFLATDGGHIDIAYVSPLAREYIPRTVRNFLSLEQNKNITFNFNQDITSVKIEGLKKGAYDLIFGSYSANEPNIEFVPIIKQEIVAIFFDQSGVQACRTTASLYCLGER